MNKKTNFSLRKLLILALIGLLIWSVGAKYITSHEEIHKKNFERYNITSKMELNYFTLGGTTIPKSNQDYNQCNDFCKLSQSLNDIIGYNVSLIIYAVVVFYIINLAVKKYEKSK